MTVRLLRHIALAALAAVPVLAGADLAEARRLAREGRLAEARAAFEQIVQSEGADAAAFAGLGKIDLAEERLADAAGNFEQAVALDPQKSAYHVLLGEAYGRLAEEASLFAKPGLAARSRRAFERGVELDPASHDATLGLFTFYLRAPALVGGGTDKAIALARRFQELDPFAGAVLLSQALQQEKRWAEAEAALRAALEARPGEPGALLALGTVLMNSGDYERAFAHFRQLARDDPGNPMWSYQIGRAASISGLHLDEGLAALRAFLAASEAPRDAPKQAAHWRIGLIEEKRGDKAAARAAYRAALALEPGFAPAAEALEKLR